MHTKVGTMPLFEGEGPGDESTGRPSPNVCGSHEEIVMKVPKSSHAGNNASSKQTQTITIKVLSILNLELPLSASHQA